jgi:hypothetical protein
MSSWLDLTGDSTSRKRSAPGEVIEINSPESDTVSTVSSADSAAKSGSRIATEQRVQTLGLIPPQVAWDFDISDFLDAPLHMPQLVAGQTSGDNFKNYQEKKTIFVLVVIEDMDLQAHLLW